MKKLLDMKKYLNITILGFMMSWVWVGCSDDFPIDEDGLLITSRSEAYVGNFDLRGADFLTVLSRQPEIDTVAQTIRAEVAWGTDLTNLYPQFSLVNDAKLEPKITGRVDFSDIENPKVYTVISGDRKVEKPYMVIISVQQP